MKLEIVRGSYKIEVKLKINESKLIVDLTHWCSTENKCLVSLLPVCTPKFLVP